jgi:hypothetical protein
MRWLNASGRSTKRLLHVPDIFDAIKYSYQIQSCHQGEESSLLPLSLNVNQSHTSLPVIGNSMSRLPMPIETSHIVSGRTLLISAGEHTEPRSPVKPHSCEGPECAVAKVLETTELLEHVLTFLPTSQILSLQQLNKTWHSLITSSPRLRLHQFVKPQWRRPSLDSQLLPLAIPGLEIRRGSAVHMGHWVEVRVDLAATQQILNTRTDSPAKSSMSRSPYFANDFVCTRLESSRESSISSSLPAYADLLITQPPLKSMVAYLANSNDAALNHGYPATESPEKHSRAFPAAHSKISCDAGISLGFLAEVAESLLKTRKNRKAACKVEKREDKRGVVFKAIVSYGVQSDVAPRIRSTTRTVTSIE